MVVTRFCPSPTGYLHIGGARTALFSWAYARKNKGRFLLRMEDTDQQRSSQAYVNDIIDNLDWLGLTWDDEIVYQSQRLDIYRTYAKQLIQGEYAYEKDGAVYFRPASVTQDGITVNDLILGDVSFPKFDSDFVILKSDGYPTFHLAVVVDDATSGVTHVVRGMDHLTNTPSHMLLQRALGLPTPVYAHLPLICEDDGKPMSKRNNTGYINVIDFQTGGYLPEALLNYIALLGWSDPQDRFDMAYLAKHFDLAKICKSNAKFDRAKLLRFNQEYIAKLSAAEYQSQLKAILWQDWRFQELVDNPDFLEICQPRSKTLLDAFTVGKLFVEESRGAWDEPLDESVREIYNMLEIGWDDIPFTLAGMSKTQLQTIRKVLSGGNVTPPMHATLKILGKEKTLERFAHFLKRHD